MYTIIRDANHAVTCSEREECPGDAGHERDDAMRRVHGVECMAASDEVLRAADCVVVVTGHRNVDYARVLGKARLVVDCCNATAGILSGQDKIIRLGAAE